ncbi:XkdX family protein [Listeria sp. ILCC792]|nr:XkdX family protein [Listeria sp. ILCC792]
MNYPKVNDIKIFYDWGLYGNEDVVKFVGFGAITKEEYQEITGEVYPE